MHKSQSLINHVAMVLDGSISMKYHQRKVVEVADDQIKHLAKISEEMHQETRVSVYLFGSTVECLIFDMDVMRLPSIAELYRLNGNTALIDATLKSQQDLATTSQLYGDHAFLTYVLTDGQENWSKNQPSQLTRVIQQAPENWTLAFLVPDRSGTQYLTRYGISDGNIAIWDTTSAAGMVDAGKTIRTATDNFMRGRASGIRGTRSVFSTSVDTVNTATVETNLEPLKPNSYQLLDVPIKVRIDDRINGAGIVYRKGMAYYELSKTETIQPQKEIIVVNKHTGQAYSGKHARNLIGLPNEHVRVKPDYNPDYTIYVQSTSFNRVLVPKTKVLVKS